MSEISPYKVLNRHGLLGLYRLGLFDPISCDYEGTFFQRAWESCEIPDLIEDMSWGGIIVRGK